MDGQIKNLPRCEKFAAADEPGWIRAKGVRISLMCSRQAFLKITPTPNPALSKEAENKKRGVMRHFEPHNPTFFWIEVLTSSGHFRLEAVLSAPSGKRGFRLAGE
jgi:hypothetical protein